MGLLDDPGALVAAISGLALVALGLLVDRVRPRRAASVAFTLFTCLWGLQIVAANLARVADATTASLWTHAFVALLVPLHVPLLAFAFTYPTTPSTWRRHPILVTSALVAPSVALLALYAAWPSLFVVRAGVGPSGGGLLEAGPLFVPIALANALFSFAVALAFTTRRLLRTDRTAAREQLALLGMAFVTYTSYQVVDNAALALRAGGPLLFPRLTASAAVAGVVVWTLASVARRVDLPWRAGFPAAAAVPAAVALAEAGSAALGGTAFDTIGVWRLIMATLFAYAILRYRLFDVEIRLKSAMPTVTYASAFLLGLALLWALAGETLVSFPIVALVVSLSIAAVCAPAARLAERAIDRAAPHVASEPDYIYKRKLDVYRAALEEAEAHGMGDATESAFLSDLRRGLGIAEEEHRVLLMVLRSQDRFTPAAGAVAVADQPRFVIEREIGRGGAGRALLARDLRLDRRVVLKQPLASWVLDPKARDEFLREARLAARIRHPNVVVIYEVLPDESPPIMVLEHVEGGSLEDRLRTGRRLSTSEVVALARGLLAGLAAIHRAGIIHRDLKPANVLLDVDGTPKVTDFGIAQARTKDAGATTQTADSRAGSVAFMSPEQARGERLDARSDLYAVGLILRGCMGEPGDDPTIAALDAVAARALALRREERFASAEEMSAALPGGLDEKAPLKLVAPPTAGEARLHDGSHG